MEEMVTDVLCSPPLPFSYSTVGVNHIDGVR